MPTRLKRGTTKLERGKQKCTKRLRKQKGFVYTKGRIQSLSCEWTPKKL